MNAIDTITAIAKVKALNDQQLRYCLIDEFKRPFKTTDEYAKPNCVDDFVVFDKLYNCNHLTDYAGVGISIQASNVCAIDVDNCFSQSFDLATADERAKIVINEFAHLTYSEFSFSGKGLRILFRANEIVDYSKKYYTKNKNKNIEYYQPAGSYRFVSLTGKNISDETIMIANIDDGTVLAFLNEYMQRPDFGKSYCICEKDDGKSLAELLQKVKFKYLTDVNFQNLWYGLAPGSGQNESELDFALVSYIYRNFTTNREKVKCLFEQSPYFKTKDELHKNKWYRQNYRYFNFQFDHIRR